MAGEQQYSRMQLGHGTFFLWFSMFNLDTPLLPSEAYGKKDRRFNSENANLKGWSFFLTSHFEPLIPPPSFKKPSSHPFS